jgi:mono/diheme cytochrome c family protein
MARHHAWIVAVALSACVAPVDADESPAGKAAYDRLCASCHGPDGRGNPGKAKALKLDPKVLNLGRPEVAKLSREELRRILLEGKDKMPAYEQKLAPAEVDPVLDHAMKLAEEIRRKK